MIFALLFAIMVGSALWGWWHQQRALRVLRQRPSHRATTDPAPPAPPLPMDTPVADPAPDLTATRASVRQLERAAPSAGTSVLGWEAFSIRSTMVLDGTALVGCRRQSDPRFVELAGPSDGTVVDGSFVLLIGEDDRADQAVALLDRWCATAVTVHLRPTPVMGAIELFDERANALRASLLAD